MINSGYINATDVRKCFSETLDGAVYGKPQYIKRTRNHVIMISEDMLLSLLENAKLHVSVNKNEDGSFFVLCDEIEDIISTGGSAEEALTAFCEYVSDYANEYYENYDLYSRAPNRKPHLPYVMRILSSPTAENVKEMLICQAGRN